MKKTNFGKNSGGASAPLAPLAPPSMLLLLNVCKQTFHISHLRVSQKVKGILMWNLQHIIFIWRRRYWQVFIFALEYLQSNFIKKRLKHIRILVNIAKSSENGCFHQLLLWQDKSNAVLAFAQPNLLKFLLQNEILK